MYKTRRPFAARRNPMTAPDLKATINAFPTPFRASNVVLAFAYVAIFIPRKPDTTEVTAPSKKDMVLNRAVARAGLQVLVVSYVQAWLFVLNPSTDPRKRKIKIAKATMNTPTYWYIVKRKEVAPVTPMGKTMNNQSQKIQTMYYPTISVIQFRINILTEKTTHYWLNCIKFIKYKVVGKIKFIRLYICKLFHPPS